MVRKLLLTQNIGDKDVSETLINNTDVSNKNSIRQAHSAALIPHFVVSIFYLDENSRKKQQYEIHTIIKFGV
jgi:hypothetical protein